MSGRSTVLESHRWFRYGMTLCVIVAASAGTRVLMSTMQGSVPSVLLFAGVVLCAWIWGAGPGVFAAFLAGISTEFFLVGQSRALHPTDDLIRFAVFTGIAVLISYARPAWRRQAQSQASEVPGRVPLIQSSPVASRAFNDGTQAIAAAMLSSIKGAAITMVDHAWRLIYVNEDAARLLGRPIDELIGSSLFAALPDAKGSEWFKRLRTAIDSSDPLHFDAFVGSLNAWIDFHCYPSAEGLCLHVANINERKKQEALRPLAIWEDNREFKRILSKIEFTLVDHSRCYMLYQFAKIAQELDGDVAEVGVYKGGTAKLLAETFACKCNKLVHLFDTFEGMPNTDPTLDRHHAGDFRNTSLEAVQKQLHGNSNARFYKGFFPATAGPIEDKQFCFVHVDVDIYQSVKDCCIFFYPRLEPRGVLIFDDYGFSSCPGARKAVDEFFADKPEAPFYLPSGQCVVVKK